MKRVMITGASGMVGSSVLEYCSNHSEVSDIISLVRKKSNLKDEKLTEVVVSDFSDYSNYLDLFKDVDAAFFCIGTYTGQVPDDQFKMITVDYAVAFAEALMTYSPNARYCLLSGAGADRSEKSRASFARYKGMAENQISDLASEFYAFRPGYIYPVTPRREPNLMYRIMRWFYPLMGSTSSIRSTDLAKAIFNVGLNGANSEILENEDILQYV